MKLLLAIFWSIIACNSSPDSFNNSPKIIPGRVSKTAPIETHSILVTIPAEGITENGEALLDIGEFFYYLATGAYDNEDDDDAMRLAQFINAARSLTRGPLAKDVTSSLFSELSGTGIIGESVIANARIAGGRQVAIRSIRTMATDMRSSLAAKGVEHAVGVDSSIAKTIINSHRVGILRGTLSNAVKNGVKDGYPVGKAIKEAFAKPEIRDIAKDFSKEELGQLGAEILKAYGKSKMMGGFLGFAMASPKMMEKIKSGETILGDELEKVAQDYLKRLELNEFTNIIDLQKQARNFTAADGNPLVHVEIKGDGDLVIHASAEDLQKMGPLTRSDNVVGMRPPRVAGGDMPTEKMSLLNRAIISDLIDI